MKIMIVEDQEEMRDYLIEELAVDSLPVDVTFATCFEAAIEKMTAEEFDLIVCDLRIPRADASLDAAVEHGYAVHAYAREHMPGVPLLFLTGHATMQETGAALSQGPTIDLFGGDQVPVVQVIEKDRLRDFNQFVAGMCSEFADLERIGVSGLGGDIPSRELVERALRIYARRRGASVVDVKILTGLSGSVVLRAAFRDSSGGDVCSTFAKVGPHQKSLGERARYQRYVQGVLPLGTFAPDAGVVSHNLRGAAALFYTIADGYDRSVFDLVVSRASQAETLVGDIRSVLGSWYARLVDSTVSVGELRRRYISDAKLGERGHSLAFGEDFEREVLPVPFSIQHGDLHGGNVLVDPDGRLLVIDFGDVDELPIATDPVTLELSLVFHSDSPLRGSAWPTIAQAEHWWDLDRYLEGCPVPDFIRECRMWTTDLAQDGLEGLFYAHASRQLKYDDVAPDLAYAFAKGAVFHAVQKR